MSLKKVSVIRKLPFILTPLFLVSCLLSSKDNADSIPSVAKVDIARYSGKWFEIARIDHSFEKGLVNVTATYTPKQDGKIEVRNEGYKETPKKIKKQAIGRAFVPDSTTPGTLKVSFFLFFWASYKIVALDTAQYSYAMVTSNTKDYLWILSRTPKMDQLLYDSLLIKASSLGFDTTKLNKVPQQWPIE